MSIFKEPTDNFVSTTLNGSVNDSVDTITLNDASKLQYPGYVVIDREDGNGTATPNSREVVSYTGISGNTLTGCTRGADNSTARSHSDGALVEATVTVGMWGGLRSAFTGAFGDAGTDLIASNATISTNTQLSKLAVSSVASIARTEVSYANEINMALSSLASIARVSSPYYEGIRVAINSIASIAWVSGINVAASSIASIARVEYTTSNAAFTSNASGAIAVDFSAGKVHTRILGANTTISFSNPIPGQSVVIRVTQDGTGSRTAAWYPGSAGTTVIWAGGTAPTLTTTASKTDVVSFFVSNASLFDGYLVAQNL